MIVKHFYVYRYFEMRKCCFHNLQGRHEISKLYLKNVGLNGLNAKPCQGI